MEKSIANFSLHLSSVEEAKGEAPRKLLFIHLPRTGDELREPELYVKFTLPMVDPSFPESMAQDIPFELNPLPDGVWRWKDAQTAVFDTNGKGLPLATSYRGLVPKSMKALTGESLEFNEYLNFRTPAIKIASSFPHDRDVVLKPQIFIEFNIPIEPQDIRPYISFADENKNRIAFHLVPETEYAQNREIMRQIGSISPERFIVIAPNRKLKPNTKYTINLIPDGRSEIGRVLDSRDGFSFSTYGKFQLMSSSVSKVVTPGERCAICFTNIIDEKKFAPSSQVTVTPDLEDQKITCDCRLIEIVGKYKENSTYTVTIAKSLTDIFGQTLDCDITYTFETRQLRREIRAIGDSMVVLNPQGSRQYLVYTLNEDKLQVTINAVQPEDYPEYLSWRAEQSVWRVRAMREEGQYKMPGRNVFAETIAIESPYNTFMKTPIDISPALNSAQQGQVIVMVRNCRRWPEEETIVIAWVQVTDIGLSAYADSKTIKARATDLTTGQPLLVATINGSPVDEHGIATLAREQLGELLIAKCGDDCAFLNDINNLPLEPQLRDIKWHVFSDRGIYRPKETANIKGWLRPTTADNHTNIDLVLKAINLVAWRATDSFDEEFGTGTCSLNAYGGFDCVIPIPEDIEFGNAKVTFKAIPRLEYCDDAKREFAMTEIIFDIQEFAKAQSEVQLVDAPDYAVLGDECYFSAIAHRFVGNAISNAEVSWYIQADAITFCPPDWKEFIFGTWQPWWECYWYPEFSKEAATYLGMTTNSSGRTTLKLLASYSENPDLPPLPPLALNLYVNVNTYPDERSGNDPAIDLILHPSTLYVGLKSERLFVDKGSPIELEYVVTDITGQVQSDVCVKLRSARIFNEFKKARYSEIEDDVQEQTVISGSEPKPVVIVPNASGRYRIYAEVSDAKGRRNFTQIYIWVPGIAQPESQRLHSKEVELVPGKRHYRIGETAEVLVISPFAPAEGLLTLNQSGIISAEHFSMSDNATIIKVPITAAHAPNLHVRVDLLGQQPSLFRDDDMSDDHYRIGSDYHFQLTDDFTTRPATASGAINLSIPPLDKTLSLQILPSAAEFAPEDEVEADIVVTDCEGQPVSGVEVAIAVIDEATLGLVDYKIPNPVASFYSDHELQYADRDLRSLIQLADPYRLYDKKPSFQKRTAESDGFGDYSHPRGGDNVVKYDDSDDSESYKQYRKRKQNNRCWKILEKYRRAQRGLYPSDFAESSRDRWPMTFFDPRKRSTQLMWVPSDLTDANGRVHVSFKLPNYPIRFRITAVAADTGNNFGYGERTVSARITPRITRTLPSYLKFKKKPQY